ncbi:MAG: NAD(P)-dependent alcohol dehydrogenase [Wenzhouxiangellaceae bacterium]
MNRIRAVGAQSPTSGLAPMAIERRSPRPDDVVIRIDYCGICHTDIHFVHNDWSRTRYPVVPGHEIVGTVTDVGSNVRDFKAGDRVGVGCMVDACRHCESCNEGLEQYCDNGFVATYNGEDLHDHSTTFGGYSESIVVSERFVLRIPDTLDPAAAAPLLCAGITTWSPLAHFGVRAGQKIAVVGLGGLGHMAIKFARALGAEVTVFSRSESKRAEAERLGAHRVVISTDPDQMAAVANRYDLILDTVPVQHDLNPYLAALRRDGTLVLVGLLEPVEPPLDAAAIIFRRKQVAGSLIGGIAETQAMLDFCGKHQIVSDIEMLDIADINQAYERVQRSDVRYRFVIDMNTLRATG